MKNFPVLWNKHGITIVALLLLFFGLFSGWFGYFSQNRDFRFLQLIEAFYSNISVELISIAITVLVLDKLSLRRRTLDENEQLRSELIQQARSQVNEETQKAIEKLAAYEWLFDGSMESANLQRANWCGIKRLENANLRDCKLRGANLAKSWLYETNLQNADLRWANFEQALLFKTNLQDARLYGSDFSNANFYKADLRSAFCVEAKIQHSNIWESDLTDAEITFEQLAEANRLRGSIMPNGARYNGFLNLPGDLEDAQGSGVDIGNPEGLAEWYVVSLDEYQQGQEWARNNLNA